MFKIIDYAGATVEDGFVNARFAYTWLNEKFSIDFIREMHFRVIREEEEDERYSSEL